MSRRSLLILALCLLSYSSCASRLSSVPPCRVVRIVDGDTLMIEIEGTVERVRLRRVNAPEMDEPGGPEAKAALQRQFPVGSAVHVTPYARDVYGRLVADVSP